MHCDTARVGRPARGLSARGRSAKRLPAILKAAPFVLPLTVLLSAGPALAQRDDPGLQLNCADDFFRLCAGTDPQSSEADNCMNRNRGRLSAACRAAIGDYEGRTGNKTRR